MTSTPDLAVLAWLSSIGAAPAADIAAACGASPRSAAARLRALEAGRLSRSVRLLHGEPSLHTLTRRGLRAAGCSEYEPTRISAANFAHFLAVSAVATALRTGGRTVGGEKELRALERAGGAPLASAAVGVGEDGSPAWHRPDLVCWDGDLPTAIEVELTVKAPKRLRAIVRGWARSRLISSVVYYATPAASRAVASAVASESAHRRVAIQTFEREHGAVSTVAVLDR
ncbi:MAG TPA: hypothetical protein VHX66_07535 [Solirubrobacteraceae bacterium]|jgi:hypothetical protein|nr:hypothetical protein [Solirubrobacteraceae bacterium]